MALSQNQRDWVRFLVLDLGADLNLAFGNGGGATTYFDFDSGVAEAIR